MSGTTDLDPVNVRGIWWDTHLSPNNFYWMSGVLWSFPDGFSISHGNVTGDFWSDIQDMDEVVVTGLGDVVDNLVNFVPEVKRLWYLHKNKGGRVDFASGLRTSGEYKDGNIIINENLKDHPIATFMALVHELAHSANPVVIQGYPQRDAYVRAYLDGEGTAVMMTLDVLKVVELAGIDVQGYTYNPTLVAIYNSTSLSESEKIHQMGQVFGNIVYDGKTHRSRIEESWDNDPHNPHLNPQQPPGPNPGGPDSPVTFP